MIRKIGAATRRGISAIETAFVVGLIAIIVLLSVAALGNSTSDKLDETATDVADPASLRDRFGG